MSKKALKATIAAGAVYAGIGFLSFYEVTGRGAHIPGLAMKSFDKRHSIPSEKPKKANTGLDWYHEHVNEFEEYEIKGTTGENLRGYLIPTDEPSNKIVLCSHGYRSNKGEFRFICKYLHDKGFNVFLIEHRSSGKSDGRFISFGAYESKDLLLWTDFLIKKFGADCQIALYGISMGSASVMLASNQKDLPENVKFIIADCGFTSVNEEFEFNLKSMYIPEKPILFIANQFSKLVGKWDFNAVSPLKAVRGAKVPILFIHGEDDDFVPTEMACRLYNACCSEKDLLTIPGAGHACCYQTNPEAYEEKVNAFADKYFK